VRTALGYSLGALTEGTDFKCNAALCYGVGAVHDQFKALQATLNQFANAVGFAPLAVDGFIGPLTVAAAQAAASAAGLASPGTTIEDVAANAVDLTMQLGAAAASALDPNSIADIDTPTSTPPLEMVASTQRALDICASSPLDPICTQTRTFCRRTRGTAQATLPEVQQLCSGLSQIQWRRWFLIGLGVAVTGVAVGTVVHRVRRRRGSGAYDADV
jgi:hypothetical protein